MLALGLVHSLRESEEVSEPNVAEEDDANCINLDEVTSSNNGQFLRLQVKEQQ